MYAPSTKSVAITESMLLALSIESVLLALSLLLGCVYSDTHMKSSGVEGISRFYPLSKCKSEDWTNQILGQGILETISTRKR